LHHIVSHAPSPLSASYPFPRTAAAPADIYTLSLHDALPIWPALSECGDRFPPRAASVPQWKTLRGVPPRRRSPENARPNRLLYRSEEHTSELQSRSDLVCRLLLEKKKESFNAWSTPPPCTMY